MGETICAIATPPGKGGIGVVRLSGEKALAIAKAVFSHKGKWESHRLYYGHVFDQGRPIDEALAVYMKAPRSYTAEDVVELQVHGGSVTTEATLQALLHAGASLAEPGEFTRRAFLNGRIALDQAEAVMDLVSAKTGAAARQALSRVEGALTTRVRALQQRLTDVAAALEVFIDYPDEDLEDQAIQDAMDDLSPLRSDLAEALRRSAGAELLQKGARVVLFGAPNAGKSSLLNALVGEDRAIVTDIAGTTRDVLREEAELYGLPVTYCDTAGLRLSSDRIERLGVERARREVEAADVALYVVDAASPQEGERIEAVLPLLIALNKTDLAPVVTEEALQALYPQARIIRTCAVTGEGVEDLKKALYGLLTADGEPETAWLANERHREAVRAALVALDAAVAALDGGLLDCAALEVRGAYRQLGLITGETADEGILDRIFERFCLGK